MTAQAFSSLTSLMVQTFADAVEQQVNQATVLPRLLPQKAGTNQVIQWDARVAKASSATTANDGADAVSPATDTKVPAILNYGRYTDSFSVTGFSVAAAMASGNPSELADLFLEEMGECARRLAFLVAGDLFTGTGATNVIMGLTDATNGVLLDSGTYANIARGTYSSWKGNVDANGGITRALSVKLMDTMATSIYTASGMNADLIVTTPKLFQKYGESFGDNRRWLDSVRTAAGEIKLGGGFQALDFNGIPVIKDINCPANTMCFLNTNTLDLMYLPAMTPTAARAGASEAGLNGTPESQYGAGGAWLQAKIQPLAVSGDNYKFQVICYPQLKCRRPNANGMIQNLSEA